VCVKVDSVLMTRKRFEVQNVFMACLALCYLPIDWIEKLMLYRTQVLPVLVLLQTSEDEAP